MTLKKKIVEALTEIRKCFFKACRVDTIQKVFFAAPEALTSPSEIGNISGMGQPVFVPFPLPANYFTLQTPF